MEGVGTIGGLTVRAFGTTAVRTAGVRAAYQRARQGVGRPISSAWNLDLADIVLTITVDQTLDSALTRRLIVLIRTFLSFSLETELDGALPWRRGGRSKQSAAATGDSDAPGVKETAG